MLLRVISFWLVYLSIAAGLSGCGGEQASDSAEVSNEGNGESEQPNERPEEPREEILSLTNHLTTIPPTTNPPLINPPEQVETQRQQQQEPRLTQQQPQPLPQPTETQTPSETEPNDPPANNPPPAANQFTLQLRNGASNSVLALRKNNIWQRLGANTSVTIRRSDEPLTVLNVCNLVPGYVDFIYAVTASFDWLRQHANDQISCPLNSLPEQTFQLRPANSDIGIGNLVTSHGTPNNGDSEGIRTVRTASSQAVDLIAQGTRSGVRYLYRRQGLSFDDAQIFDVDFLGGLGSSSDNAFGGRGREVPDKEAGGFSYVINYGYGINDLATLLNNPQQRRLMLTRGSRHVLLPANISNSNDLYQELWSKIGSVNGYFLTYTYTSSQANGRNALLGSEGNDASQINMSLNNQRLTVSMPTTTSGMFSQPTSTVVISRQSTRFIFSHYYFLDHNGSFTLDSLRLPALPGVPSIDLNIADSVHVSLHKGHSMLRDGIRADTSTYQFYGVVENSDQP